MLSVAVAPEELLLLAALLLNLVLLLRIERRKVIETKKATLPGSAGGEASEQGSSPLSGSAERIETDPLLDNSTTPTLELPQVDLPSLDRGSLRKNLLAATSGRLFSGLRAIFASGGAQEQAIYKELERSLIEGDVGVVATEKLLAEMREVKRDSALSLPVVEEELKSRMIKVFDSLDGASLNLLAKPTVLVLVGINGVGKTTTAGKIAQKYAQEGKKVLLGACDTFRAAAVSQLQIWGDRSGVEVVFGSENSKPATVAYTACKKAEADGVDLLILDTAGRLHNKKNLMDELGGVIKIISRELPGAPHEILLVVDSTSGQNALEQARSFNEICKLTGIVVTKLDGSPRGGMLFAIRSELGIPVRYIGLGEGIDDLELFKPTWFVDELFL